MLTTIDNSLELKWKECETLKDAELFGESICHSTYHILIKTKKKKHIIGVVYHLPYIECDFCKLDTGDEPFIWM